MVRNLQGKENLSAEAPIKALLGYQALSVLHLNTQDTQKKKLIKGKEMLQQASFHYHPPTHFQQALAILSSLLILQEMSFVFTRQHFTSLLTIQLCCIKTLLHFYYLHNSTIYIFPCGLVQHPLLSLQTYHFCNHIRKIKPAQSSSAPSLGQQFPVKHHFSPARTSLPSATSPIQSVSDWQGVPSPFCAAAKIVLPGKSSSSLQQPVSNHLV